MLNKEDVLMVLEAERQQAANFNLPQMALGIAHAISMIKSMEVADDDKATEVLP